MSHGLNDLVISNDERILFSVAAGKEYDNEMTLEFVRRDEILNDFPYSY